MKTMKFFSMAALALMGAMMTGCSSEDNLAGNQQSAKQDNIVTVTTTIGLGGGDATTRALSATGVKTFAEGDQIALFYVQNGSSDPVKAVATAENISADGKSATFTFTLSNPESGSNIALCYPAAFMDNPSGELRPALTQDGTLNGSVKANDLGYATGNLVGTDLPASISLTNPFAVVAFTLKDGKGTDDKADDVDVTSTITEMTIELPDYHRTYTITRSAAAGPIYVVLNQTDNTDAININATGGGKTYTKIYTKAYAASNFYQQGLLMTEKPDFLSGVFSVSSTKKVKFSKGNLRYASGTWSFFNNQYDYYISYSADAWDHFGWSTSATTYGMNTSTDNSTYSGSFVDWGSNSDLQTALGTGWFTLSNAEWQYLFNTRSASTVGGTSKGRYAKANVNNVHGVILFPDTYTHPDGVNAPTNVNTTDASFDSNTYTIADWTKMESAGCVFLPNAGYRDGSSLISLDIFGGYWSATPHDKDANYAYYVYYYAGYVDPAYNANERRLGFSVRLVRGS